ncbi:MULTISPECIES: MATE family efflux transporter [Bacillota]|jgi:putative MATE family efflux protein|uniref:Probable multidrug resistance protein NorM n=2 Tax=Amedibacillus TaxID=2749846 RepID=A0A7G9GRE2_9FIRM|nr:MULTISPECIES: MATE family efflux transporter [Bacillota]QNM13374.1 MATE family efflux transporter [[Eubacterium] hominis]MCH4287062.1 MATE family efflux transporter [Amedibacillus hominis]RGB50439.1 MATE family efflux transporter [Absiella sp. AM22-9]RGB58762.1 MATE family efflux transporter [Absiella sp. AM10-20]RGB64998.1 MATE family efflux transporter [Absiella sp. AM09-45]
MEENKMGVMEIKKLIMTMSLPIMISMLVQALYNIVDSMFVARVSDNALAAVSLCYPIQMIIVAVACGTAVGLNALLSRYLGQKKPKEANQVALHGILLAIVNWLIFAIIGIFFSEAFLRLFSTDQEIVAMGISYMKICTIFSFGVFMQITYERIMQSTGNTVYNMIIQGVGALVNIMLDPIFIFGMLGLPAMGVTGAAIATVIGQIVAMLLGIIITQTKIKEVQIHLREFHLELRMIKDMYRIAIPAILMQSIMSFMTVFMNMILVTFSELAVSAFSIYFKLQQFVFMAVNGMNNALIPIISYNFGAKKKQRILDSIHFSLIVACVIMIAGTIIFQCFPQQLMYLFDANEEMMNIGVPALRIISLSFIFAGISLVLSAVFQSVDHANKSLMITLLRQMVLLLPIVYLLANQFGLNALWWAFPITEAAVSILAYIYLKIVKAKTIMKISQKA